MKINQTNNYFSQGLSWTFAAGSLALSTYLMLSTDFAWVILVLVLVSSIMFSTKYVLLIDTNDKIILDSFEMLGFILWSDKSEYDNLTCIKVENEKHSYTANSRSRVRQVNFTEYIGHLNFDIDKSIELARGTDFESFSEEIEKIAGQLNLGIEQ